jgi:hypothetical protein
MKTAVAEHSINLGHHTQLQNTIILAKKTESLKVTEIEPHSDNMNREDSFMGWASKSLICDLKEWRQFHTKELTQSNGH